MEKKTTYILDQFTKKPPLKFPERKDGYPDFNKWEEFVNQFDYKTIGDLMAIRKHVSQNGIEGELLNRAIFAKKEEIVLNFKETLSAENISVQEAISILEETKRTVLDTKFT